MKKFKLTYYDANGAEITGLTFEHDFALDTFIHLMQNYWKAARITFEFRGK